MDPRRLVRLLSATRACVGASMLARPEALPRAVGVDAATAGRVRWLTLMVGARELALGAGTLLALRDGGDARPWVLAQGVSDAGDVMAFAGAVGRGHAKPVPGVAVLLAAGTGLAAAVYALRRR